MPVSLAPEKPHTQPTPTLTPRTGDPGRPGPPGGRVEVHPRHRQRLSELGLTTARALLDLPGEVVSGHPDRHVVRVELPGWGRALYLKRQHRVGWKERLRQGLAGFGWSSRCEREARLLRALDASGFPCPEWVAYGEEGGRAFLLVEELHGGVELRRLLSDTRLSLHDRARLAERLGQAVAELHAAGFDTPDLTAKHVFVHPESFAVTLLDWQSSRRVVGLAVDARARALAALHASLADHLGGLRERLRFLWAYRRVVRRAGMSAPPFAALARTTGRLSVQVQGRRSIRDQRQPVGAGPNEQRLVWLRGEAVCAVPDVAAVWPSPPIAPPFYDDAAEGLGRATRIRLADGRPADLLRGKSFAPVGRFVSWLRNRPWRSPGATIGRILFHLQRYGIPAPRLFAFGQRETGRAAADWFGLYEPPAGLPLEKWLSQSLPLALRHEVFEQVGLLLRQLHDAGCRYSGAGPLFWVAGHPAGQVSIGGIGSVHLTRRMTARRRRTDLLRLFRSFPHEGADRPWVVRGYYGPQWANNPNARQLVPLVRASERVKRWT